MHYLGIRIHSQSMIAHKTMGISGNSGEILHSGNVVNMPNSYVRNFCNRLIFIREEFIVVISFNCGKIVQYVDF